MIQPVDEHDLAGMENEIREIRRLSEVDFCLIACKVKNWNGDLSPWEAPAVFGAEAFSGGAENTLEEILKLCEDREKTYVIGGYSLAGLFALWAALQTDAFAGVAAASPSVWFPGFLDHAKERKIACKRVYLSLGDREEKTRNPLMATVGDCIRELEKIFTSQGAECTLEWNQGNHFKDADLRTAKAFAWVMNEKLMRRP